ncbi:RNA polymerase sigma-70 factor, ECF subfamily [Sphingopyxis sp. YR583]|uniref:RNA polymerase sigma factor n=1 Tax=Sphingopyxis sp. YR583 TaxID=1881047 RepID=UPI0008A772BF|nr:RNA polymerase sigma factor [Sphingopyxis sp. YR583]SEH14961.1 RNA polymerase sigma-70 factor, ECF subfamily [Sphingopyxis sp. YR583]
MSNPDSKPLEPEPHDSQSQRTIDAAYRQWWKSLVNSVGRQFGAGPPDPEEAVQAAFEKFSKLAKPEDVADPQSYLYVSARNYVLDQRRRTAVRNSALDIVELMEEGDAPANYDTERVYIGREHLAIVATTLDAMDERRREVMTMHVIDGLPYAEISRRMGVSETRVRQLMASALSLCTIAINAVNESDTE